MASDKHGGREDEVYSITSASEGHSDELGAREIRYAISMGVRTVSFVAGVLLWSYAMWAAVILLVLAVFLPYTSVILANAGVRKHGEGKDFMKPEPYGRLPEGGSGDDTRD